MCSKFYAHHDQWINEWDLCKCVPFGKQAFLSNDSIAKLHLYWITFPFFQFIHQFTIIFWLGVNFPYDRIFQHLLVCDIRMNSYFLRMHDDDDMVLAHIDRISYF